MKRLPRTYYDVKGSKKRIVVNQGGTRSGKTYSILQLLIEWAFLNKNMGYTISVCRKTYPALRTSAMRDFINILKSENMYDESKHNMSSAEYHLFGNLVEFISVDQPQKIRGRKRHILFINEANELSWEDFFQLNIRTTYKVVVDYNPSDEYHWIYDNLLPRDDVDFFKTTYLDNPFLTELEVLEIERLKETDSYYWQVYGLGERGQSPSVIFTSSEYDNIPDGANLLGYGLDFGFSNSPTALVACYLYQDMLFFEELIYQTGLTNSDLAAKMKELSIPRTQRIVADSAEPKSIEELHRMGFNIHPCFKGKDAINLGIDIMKRYKLRAHKGSLNLIKEFRNYKWQQDKNGKILNEPVKMFDHLMDACRYLVLDRLSRPNVGKYAVR